MAIVNCSYCGKEVYKKPYQIRKTRNGRHYCNSDCMYANIRSIKITELENKIGQSLESYLEEKYIIEGKSTTWIMNELSISSHYITDLLKKYNIKARKGSKKFENWWENITDEEKEVYINDLSDRAKRHLNTEEARDKLRNIMNTSEYKRKMHVANSGKNNGMYDPALTEEHRVDTRGLFGYKKWAKDVKGKYNYTCQKCGKKGTGRTIHAHHINDYFEYEDGRLDVENGITLCNSCHNVFHNKYKGIPATQELLREFLTG